MLATPTRQQAERARLFSGLKLPSGLSLAERTWVPAMVPWRATDSGEVTPEVISWYGRFAEGQPGAIVVEATGIRDVPSGPLLRIGHDRYVDGLRKVVQEVRERSGGRTRLFIQLIDFLRIRRRPDPERYFRQFLRLDGGHRDRLSSELADPAWRNPSLRPDNDVRAALAGLPNETLLRVLTRREQEDYRFGARERIDDMHLPHVRALPRNLPVLFADAALRAQKAGFDGVELHFAHAYTMSSFLSAKNERDDGYGGSRENRVRCPLEVYDAVRRAVGRDYTVGCRMLCDEVIDGGSGPADAAWFALRFAERGFDFLSLSTGGKFEDAKPPKVGHAAYPYTGKSGFECMPTTISDRRGPHLRNIPKQAAIRRVLREQGHPTPVVICGGISQYAQAERLLAMGAGDIIGAARQSLADPDWFRKARMGRAHEQRQCVYSNYCEALDQLHRQVTCQLWDRKGLGEPGVGLSKDGRRRLVAPAWQSEEMEM